jgi:hypothetical protein
MKRGTLIILWTGGLFSIAVLILSEPPDAISQKIDVTLGGYIVQLIAKLAVI